MSSSSTKHDPAGAVLSRLMARNPTASPMEMAAKAARIVAKMDWDDGQEKEDFFEDEPFGVLIYQGLGGYARFRIRHDSLAQVDEVLDDLTLPEVRKLQRLLALALERFETGEDVAGLKVAHCRNCEK